MAAPAIAILVPCLNEELTVARVVSDFREQLPDAVVYVFDNGSSDATLVEATRAGALIRTVPERGKGAVVRAMFASIEADIYVLVDGDATYPASRVQDLIEPIRRGLADMVVGSRLAAGSSSHFRVVNRLGNIAYAYLVSRIVGVRLTDVLSGYRAFNRQFVNSVLLQSRGFEVEMEMTIAAVVGGLSIQEVPVDLAPRPMGSNSKIRILADGWRILRTLVRHLVGRPLFPAGERA